MDVHAGVYGRQSQERENKSEASTSTQRAVGTAEANKRGASRIEYYEDIDKSAFKADVVRKDFDRLIADCRAGRINMVIVHYISRLSRLEPLDAIPVVTELLNLGVVIVSCNEGEFRKGSLMDLIHLIMRLDAAHSESKNKSIAVAGAKRGARELGGFVGGKAPYGFGFKPETRLNADGKPIVIQTLVHDDFEAAILRRVIATIRENMHLPAVPGKSHPGSITGICAAMNRDGVPTRGQRIGKKRADSKWDPTVLRRMLQDPHLAGYDCTPIYGTKADGSMSTRVNGYRIVRDPETMEPQRACAPIIPPAEWHELQDWIETRGRGRGLVRGVSLLSGLRDPNGQSILRCECGSPMGALNNDNDANKPSYRCTRARGVVQPGQHTGGNTIVQEHLNEYVAQRIFALIQTVDDHPENLEILAEATKRFGRTVEAPATAQERRQLVQERADAVQALEELYDDREAGGFKSSVGRRRFLEQEAKLEQRIEGAEARLAMLDDADNPPLPLGEWLPEENTGGDPIGPGSWWHGATLDARRSFLALFVQRVTVRKAMRRGGRAWVPEDMHVRLSVDWVKPAEDGQEAA